MSTKKLSSILAAIVASTFSPIAQAQSSLLNTNLIVNGDAESGNTGTPSTLVASIPN